MAALVVAWVSAWAWAAAHDVVARRGRPAGLRGRAMSLRLTGNRLGQVLIPSAVGAVAAGSGRLWSPPALRRRRPRHAARSTVHRSRRNLRTHL